MTKHLDRYTGLGDADRAAHRLRIACARWVTVNESPIVSDAGRDCVLDSSFVTTVRGLKVFVDHRKAHAAPGSSAMQADSLAAR